MIMNVAPQTNSAHSRAQLHYEVGARVTSDSWGTDINIYEETAQGE